MISLSAEEVASAKSELLAVRPQVRNATQNNTRPISRSASGQGSGATVVLPIAALVILTLTAAITLHGRSVQLRGFTPCYDMSANYSVEVVESMPEDLHYESGIRFRSTFDAWAELIGNAKQTLDVSAMYWTLRGEEIYAHPTDKQGELIFQLIEEAGRRGVKIRIVNSDIKMPKARDETDILSKKGLAEVRVLKMSRLVGSGINHAKLLIADSSSAYVGSANMDWRALTQIKEVGLYARGCDCLSQDLLKIFESFWLLALPESEIPREWPVEYRTDVNSLNPMTLDVEGIAHHLFFSSAPPRIRPPGRDDDLLTILSLIHSAAEFVHIEVMDYLPLLLYPNRLTSKMAERPRPPPSFWDTEQTTIAATHKISQGNAAPEEIEELFRGLEERYMTRERNKCRSSYWPEIDNALRSAAVDRGVGVRLLLGYWNHTKPVVLAHLRSLNDLNCTLRGGTLDARLFKVPATPDQAKIPFARVSHSKFMVTDKTAYIGTSNWVGGYFTSTTGIGAVMKATGDKGIPSDLRQMFWRDWTSEYVLPVPPEP